MNSLKRYQPAFFLLLAAVFLFRLWFMTTLPLSGDESYHWEWSRNLALGYYDHPGLTAYLIYLSTLLFGLETEFTVRFPALLMLSGAAVVCFFFAKRVVSEGSFGKDRGGIDIAAERAGFLAGLLILVVPVFAVFSVYISTDPPLIFFWALTLYLLYRAFEKGEWRFWIGAGIAFGLLLQSKFLGFLMLPVAGVFVLVSEKDRVWLKRPHPYVALICAFFVFLPFLWWNATHGWVTFMFNLVYRQKQIGFSFKHVGEFLASQALALSPGIFLFALFGLYHSVRNKVISSKQDRISLFLNLSSLVPLVYFLYVSFQRQVGLHWPAAGWIGAIIYLSCYWETAKVDGARRGLALQFPKEIQRPDPACSGASPKFTPSEAGRALKTLSLALCVLVTISVHLLAHIPPKLIRHHWRYAGKSSRINTRELSERFGWRELGKWVEEVREEMMTDQEEGQALRLRSGQALGVFVICPQYGLAANVAFYTPSQIRTHLWSSKKTHGENYRFWDNFSSLKGMDAVFVSKRGRNMELSVPQLEKHFREIGKPECMPVIIDGQHVRSFYLIRCYEFDGVEPEFGK